MRTRAPEYGLEFLLAFDGRIHHLEEGYWIKFEIERVKATKERPHGLSYSSRCMHRMARGWSALTMPMACRPRVPGSNRNRRRAIIGTGRKPIQGDRTSSRMLRRWSTTFSTKWSAC